MKLRDALVEVAPFLNRVLLFSLVTNLLVLAPSWYMMEVYDRVVNSRNYMTLLMLTVAVLGGYVVLEVLQWVRSRTMHEGSLFFDRRMRSRVFDAMFAARLKNHPAGRSMQALHDFRTIRDFISSSALLSLLDVPLSMLVLILLFLMHPLVGWFAVGGALLQFLIGYFNEERIREPLRSASLSSLAAQQNAGGVLRNSQVVEAMGMLGAMRGRWMNLQREFLAQQAVASDAAGTNAAFSKLLQSLVTSLLLGVGCWLTLKGEMAGSGMIVGSILGGRVLSPLVQVIANWRQIETVRDSYRRLDEVLVSLPSKEKGMPLPPPEGRLSVEGVVATAPGGQVPIIKGASFQLALGDSLAVVGPSASGKTSLSRLLTGIWAPQSGTVRLDGSDVVAWDKEELGPHVGYLPQNVELFEGTLGENIARFGRVDADMVARACAMAGLEGFVAGLEHGLDTMIGEDGAFLSGGQRQRVALARAVYGTPKFVVLDEPNSSLDEQGDEALLAALGALKKMKTTVVVVTHRVNLLAVLDKMLVLIDGQVRQFGSREEVLAALQPKAKSAGAPGSHAVVRRGAE